MCGLFIAVVHLIVVNILLPDCLGAQRIKEAHSEASLRPWTAVKGHAQLAAKKPTPPLSMIQFLERDQRYSKFNGSQADTLFLACTMSCPSGANRVATVANGVGRQYVIECKILECLHRVTA